MARIAILSIILSMCSQPHEPTTAGRFQLVVVAGDTVVRMNTTTGEAWVLRIPTKDEAAKVYLDDNGNPINSAPRWQTVRDTNDRIITDPKEIQKLFRPKRGEK